MECMKLLMEVGILGMCIGIGGAGFVGARHGEDVGERW